MRPLTSYYIWKSQGHPSPYSYFADASSLSHKKHKQLVLYWNLWTCLCMGAYICIWVCRCPCRARGMLDSSIPLYFVCLFVLKVCLFSGHEAHQFGCAGGLVGTRDCPPSNLQTPSPPGIFWWQNLKLVPVHWRPLASTFFFCSSWMSSSVLWITCQAKLGDSNVEKSWTDSNQVKVWAHSYEILPPATMVDRAICYKRKNIGGYKWLWR